MVSNDLNWKKNTDYICGKTKKKLWLLRNMKNVGLNLHELVDSYCKEVRSLLELAVPVWHSGLTKKQANQIEQVQKIALAIILGQNYISYDVACTLAEIDPLWLRREQICLKFMKKNLNSSSPLLTKIEKQTKRKTNSKVVKEFFCHTAIFFKSGLPYMARLTNKNFQEECFSSHPN